MKGLLIQVYITPNLSIWKILPLNDVIVADKNAGASRDSLRILAAFGNSSLPDLELA